MPSAAPQLDLSEEVIGLIDSLGDQACLVDPEGCIIHVNPAWEKARRERTSVHFRLKLGDNYLQAMSEAFSKGDMYAEDCRKSLSSVLAGSHKYALFDYPCHEDSYPYWYESRIVQWCVRGNVIGAFMAHHDVTAQRVMQKQLWEQSEQYRLMSLHGDMGVVTMLGTGQIMEANSRFCEISGHTASSLVGKNFVDLSVEHEQKELEKKVGELLRQNQKETSLDISVLRYGTEKRFWKCRLFQITSPRGTIRYIMALIWDMTDHLKQEEERMRASRLEAMGVLTGGISHDLNNMLMSSMVGLEIAGMRSKQAQDQAELIKEVYETLSSAADLSRRLLSFTHRNESKRERIELTEVIQSRFLFDMRGSLQDKKVHVRNLHLPVMADIFQIQQVLDNLVINAREASQEGGLVSLRMGRSQIMDSNKHGLAQGLYAYFEVSDEGSGIRKEQIKDIFDPYFSTKNRGSGLGLATSRMIVEKHGGAITVVSKVGKGSAFRVLLPLAIGGRGETPMGNAPDVDPGLAVNTRILVVDDDPGIRKCLLVALHEFGYDPVGAHDGAKAVEMFQSALRDKTPFALVILDAVMPGAVSGLNTLQAIRDADPQSKVVLCSGHADLELVRRWSALGFDGVISKPCTLRDIEHVVESLIGTAPDGLSNESAD